MILVLHYVLCLYHMLAMNVTVQVKHTFNECLSQIFKNLQGDVFKILLLDVFTQQKPADIRMT